MSIAITGTGSYIPTLTITNKDFNNFSTLMALPSNTPMKSSSKNLKQLPVLKKEDMPQKSLQPLI